MMPTRILIADDYDDNRELLRLMLENAGYAVREARDGREFVEAAHAEPPDVALIDLSMPVLDGWRALSELRADARTRTLPCVAVTAYAAEVDRQRAIAAGFDAYVTKPFRSTELVEVVERLLKEGAREVDNSPARDDDAQPRAKKIGGTNDAGRV
jgi:two-component system cell cycle response regulator DivK